MTRPAGRLVADRVGVLDQPIQIRGPVALSESRVVDREHGTASPRQELDVKKMGR